LFFLIFIIITTNLFILLSGRFYLYKGIANTYLKGRSGPSIYDHSIFASSKLEKSKNPEPWLVRTKNDKNKISETDLKFFESTKTASFLVFKGDTLIYENYWNNHAKHTISNSFSAAKTFVSLLVGIAIEEGFIKNLDEPVANYLEAFNLEDKSKITIRHLLMMASGLNWQESGKNPLSENAESYYGSDLFGLVNRQKLIEDPGVRFNYQSGNSQLLAFILEKATSRDLTDYAHEKIWSKIGTEGDALWSLDKENGDEKAFCCLYATSRDFGRLGKLISQKGKWNNEQIIPSWYMNEVLSTPQLKTDEGIPNYRYGLHIWTYFGAKNPVYYCRGILGQYIISIPNENIVVVRTGFERKNNIDIPKKYANDSNYIKKVEHKIGHPRDLFDYIRIAQKIVN
jgi:CubicO group peptidase (beta-lactamase class C family)